MSRPDPLDPVLLTSNNLATLHTLVLRAIRDEDPGWVRINGLKTLAERLDKAWKTHPRRQKAHRSPAA